MIIDTDVLIWYLRGHAKAAAFVDALPRFSLSAVTYMELLQGMRNKTEFLRFQHSLKEWNADILPITERISTRAMLLVESYYLSHALTVSDALIAATAMDNHCRLCTGNGKHYRMIKELDLQVFKP